jgi:hypothetical protein
MLLYGCGAVRCSAVQCSASAVLAPLFGGGFGREVEKVTWVARQRSPLMRPVDLCTTTQVCPSGYSVARFASNEERRCTLRRVNGKKTQKLVVVKKRQTDKTVRSVEVPARCGGGPRLIVFHRNDRPTYSTVAVNVRYIYLSPCLCLCLTLLWYAYRRRSC